MSALDLDMIPMGREPSAPEVGTFGRKVTLKVGAGFVYLAPERAEELAAQLQQAAGELRGQALAQQRQPAQFGGAA